MGGLLLAGGAMALLFMMSGGGRRTRTAASPSSEGCGATAAGAALLDRDGIIAWVDCGGRTAVQVATLRSALTAAGRRADAEAARLRWNARRAVEDEPGTGLLRNEEPAHAASDAMSSPTPPPVAEEPHGIVTLPTVDEITREPSSSSRGTPAGYDPTLARSLVGEVTAALRRRAGYRTVLTRFQRAAGLTADGIYGGMSENALRYYGGSPPAAFRPPNASEGRAAYQPPTVTS